MPWLAQAVYATFHFQDLVSGLWQLCSQPMSPRAHEWFVIAGIAAPTGLTGAGSRCSAGSLLQTALCSWRRPGLCCLSPRPRIPRMPICLPRCVQSQDTDRGIYPQINHCSVSQRLSLQSGAWNLLHSGIQQRRLRRTASSLTLPGRDSDGAPG